ncbi:LGFP repeat-containing protein [Dietzia sp.]|uniref:LGFP repeat-containing protein n=1 Tax=Dietzia sp. TaxID=1871616 RepID=UPI002FD991D9
MRTTMSSKNVVENNTVRGRRRRVLAAAVTIGAFAGLAGLSAPAANAQNSVGGKIGEEYVNAAFANNQIPQVYFGNILTPELDAARGGKWQNFANDKAIYWHPLVSNATAQEIGGAIRVKWGQTTGPEGGWEWGPLKYPTTREWSGRKSAVSGTVARGNHFEGGTVYWVPDSGTYVTWGLVRDAWWRVGAEDSKLGYPKSDERTSGAGWEQDFEGGMIMVGFDGRATIVILDKNGKKTETQGPVAVQELRAEK